jgi:serine/threonine-protein kinase
MYSGEKDWPAPPTRFLQGNGLKVPAVTGLSVEEATTLLVGLGLQVTVGRREPSETIPEGFVTRSSPGEGGLIANGMTVKIYRSSGPVGFTMPDFITTLTLEADAVLALNNAGVATVNVTSQLTCDAANTRLGYVIGQYPAPGTVQEPTEYVRVTILRLKPITDCP